MRFLLTFSPSLLAAISHFIGGWRAGYARYVNICSDFVIRDPYPPSRRAKNSPLAFAKKLPPEKLLLPGQEDLPLLPGSPPEISELQRLEDNRECGSGLGGPSNGPIKGRGVRSLVGNNEREMTDSVESCEALYYTRCSQTSLPYISATRDLRRSEAMEKCSSTTESNPDGFVRALSILDCLSTYRINASRLVPLKIYSKQQNIF